MWKILNNQAPNDLGFQFYHNARLGTKVSLNQVIRASSKYQTLRDNSFGFIGPKLWNRLPVVVTSQTDLGALKVALSKNLNKYPDKPPVPGLVYINNNSLLSFPLFL